MHISDLFCLLLVKPVIVGHLYMAGKDHTPLKVILLKYMAQLFLYISKPVTKNYVKTNSTKSQKLVHLVNFTGKVLIKSLHVDGL